MDLETLYALTEYSEFWLGLDQIHDYTKTGNWTLKVEIKYGTPSTARAGTWGVGEWENFNVANEADKYRLNIGSRTESYNMGSRDPFNYDGYYGFINVILFIFFT